jgi:hypothetical protein
MSLTSFLELPEVAAKLKPLRPVLPRKIGVPLRVAPRSKRYRLVGTAFDYLLRFELQRLAPHAIARRWVAEEVPGLICRKTDKYTVSMDLLADAGLDDYLPPEEVADRAQRIIDLARAAVSGYVRAAAPTEAEKAELAAHAIRLAKLDSVYRAMKLEPGFEQADLDDVADLLNLLAMVPFGLLLHPGKLLLNPTFGQVSALVGGADTDLIAGDILVDFKVTKAGEVTGDYLDQLLGYLLLARRRAREDASFPAINRLGVYFARHGYLWSHEVAAWTEYPQFADVAEWFFERAKEVFQGRAALAATAR